MLLTERTCLPVQCFLTIARTGITLGSVSQSSEIVHYSPPPYFTFSNIAVWCPRLAEAHLKQQKCLQFISERWRNQPYSAGHGWISGLLIPSA
jgi:hypothetical protein